MVHAPHLEKAKYLQYAMVLWTVGYGTMAIRVQQRIGTHREAVKPLVL